MAENNSSAPLLPCPFCGAAARGYEIEPHQHSAALLALVPNMPKEHQGSYAIEGDCSCGSGLIGDNQAEVTARWNARTPQAVEAQAAPAAVEDGDTTTREQYRRMFEAACVDLGRINEALGLEPDDGGADPILDAIEELRATPEPPATEDSSAVDLATMTHGEATAALAINSALHRIRTGNPADAIEPLQHALHALAHAEVQAEPVATVKSWTSGSYHRNYQLEWHKDVPEGGQLFAAPQAQPADALLRHALELAFDHIDMDSLRLSHCKDAAAIDAAMAAAQKVGAA